MNKAATTIDVLPYSFYGAMPKEDSTPACSVKDPHFCEEVDEFLETPLSPLEIKVEQLEKKLEHMKNIVDFLQEKMIKLMNL